MSITAVIPAHNEATTLPATLTSLHNQTHPPDLILVICDNCTDNTAHIARMHGATVHTTTNNHTRKAGALNQALPHVHADLVLVMDADTQLAPNWIETAHAALTPGVAAAGAVFDGQPGTLLELCQANEWQRYAGQLARTRRVWVLSGTAALIRREALEDVAEARREGRLPGIAQSHAREVVRSVARPEYYLEDAATED